MGLNAYARSDMMHAEEYLRKAVVLTGQDEARSNYQIRRAYVDLGRILVNSGRTEESETFLTKARDLQNKTMELTQQNVASAMNNAGAHRRGDCCHSAAAETDSGANSCRRMPIPLRASMLP